MKCSFHCLIHCWECEIRKFSIHCFNFVALFIAKKPVFALPNRNLLPLKSEWTKSRWRQKNEIGFVVYGKIDKRSYWKGRSLPLWGVFTHSFPLFCFTKKFVCSPTFNFNNIAEEVDWEIILRKISIGRGANILNELWMKENRKLHKIIMQHSIIKIREAMKSEK